MPLTFPSHAAAVVPLKLWRRRWFDGVALVVGSAAPDIPYSIEPYGFVHSHTWAGLGYFCVPATILLTYATRRAAPAVVANLPWRGLDDYAVLARHRHAWHVTVLSAYVGALSHRLWDMVTHASIDAGAVRFEILNEEAAFGHPWWQVLHHGSTVAGGVVVALSAVHLGRTRWLLDGGPEPVLPEPEPRVFWTVAAAVWLPGVVVQPFLQWATQPQAIIVRLMTVACLGLLAAAARAGGPVSSAGPRTRAGRRRRGR